MDKAESGSGLGLSWFSYFIAATIGETEMNGVPLITTTLLDVTKSYTLDL